MKNAFLTACVGIMVAAAFVFIACDDEPTVPEASQDFCDSVGDASAALRDLRDIDADSTMDDFEEARDQAIASYNAMVDAAVGVAGARVDQLEQDKEDLLDAIDDVPSDATFNEALGSVDDEIENLAGSIGEMLNNVNCGQESGGDSQSDE